jgi:hypothetical protein
MAEAYRRRIGGVSESLDVADDEVSRRDLAHLPIDEIDPWPTLRIDVDAKFN